MPDKQKLVATRPLTYATRRLQAGDHFQAINRDARVLKAIGKARDDYDAPVTEALPKPPDTVPPAAPPPEPIYHTPANPPSAVEPQESDPLDAMRSEAEALGVHVSRRWGHSRLLQEMDAARETQAAQEAAKAAAASPVAMTTESASALVRPWPQSNEE